MNKKEFVNTFGIEDKNLLGNIYDKYRLSLDTGMKVTTEEFYPPIIWKSIYNLRDKLGVRVEVEGYFEFGERREISFIPLNEDYFEMEMERRIVKVINRSNFKKLEHKDYLGSIMALGIKREMISDLVLDEKSCYFVTNKIILNLLERELVKAGRNPLEVEVIGEGENLPKHKFDERDEILSSLRLDAVVATLARVSRNEAVNKIEKKEVSIDYLIRESKSYEVKEGEIIAIRKIGKFYLEGIRGQTKKDRFKVRFKKFV